VHLLVDVFEVSARARQLRQFESDVPIVILLLLLLALL